MSGLEPSGSAFYKMEKNIKNILRLKVVKIKNWTLPDAFAVIQVSKSIVEQKWVSAYQIPAKSPNFQVA